MSMTYINSADGLLVSMTLKNDVHEERVRSVIGTMQMEGLRVSKIGLQMMYDYFRKEKTYDQLLKEWKDRHRH